MDRCCNGVALSLLRAFLCRVLGGRLRGRFGFGLRRCRGWCGSLCSGLRGFIDFGRWRRCFALGGALAVRGFDVAHQFVGFVLGHLATTNHVLHELARTFERESSETGCGVDDVFHRRRHLAPSFEADFMSARSHFGDGVAHVLTTMSRTATRRRRRYRSAASRSWRRGFRGVGWSRRRTTGRGIGHRNEIVTRESGARRVGAEPRR